MREGVTWVTCDPAVDAGAARGPVRALDGLPAPARAAPPLVACSGGADSTALLAAARAVAPGRVHVAVVDHGLQDGSAERSAALVAGLAAQGVPAAVHTVVVDGPGGVEAAARRARYDALRAARPHPDSAGPARSHPRRPGRDRAARARPRLGGPIAGRA